MASRLWMALTLKWCHSRMTQRKSGLALILICVSLCLTALSLAASSQSPLDLVTSGRADEAIRMLDQQIRTTPTAGGYNLLCRAQFELGAWDAGIAACEKAVALSPDNGLYHLWLGRAY